MSRCLLVVVASWLLAPFAAPADEPASPADGGSEELRKPSEEGLAALRGLVKDGLEAGAIQFTPRTKAGRARMVVADADKLRRLLKDHDADLTPALCDALTATSRSMDQSVLLDAVAEHRNDDRMRAFAALGRGESLETEGNYPEAVKKYEDACRRFSDLKYPFWGFVGQAAWGRILTAQGACADARAHLLEALALAEKVRGPASLSAADCHNSLGRVEDLLGRPREALEQFRKARDVFAQTSPEPTPDLVQAHKSIGAVLLAQGHAEEALTNFEEAVRYAKKMPEGRGRDETLATALGNLGYADMVLRRPAEAKENDEQALALRDKIDKGPSAAAAALLSNLGAVHLELGDKDACIACLERSRKMSVDLYGDRSWTVVEALRQLAAAHLHYEEVGMAKSGYEESLRIAELLGGRQHPEVAECLAGLADTALTRGDLHQALERALREKDIREHDPAARPESLTECQNRLGNIHHGLRQYDLAVQDFQEVLRRRQEAPDGKDADVAAAWKNLGTALASLGRFDQAEDALRKALEIRRRAEPPDEAEIADSLNGLGSLHYRQEDYKKALDYHQQAWDVLRKQPQESSRLTRAATLNNVGMSYYGLRQWPEAIHAFDDALNELRVRPPDPSAAPDSAQAVYGFASEDLVPATMTVQVLEERGMALLHALPEPPRYKELSEASYSFVAAIFVLEQLKGFLLESEESRLEAGEDVFNVYALLIGCQARLRALPDIKAEARALSGELAFRAAETSTARLFLRTLGESRAEVLSGLPQKHQKQHGDLLAEIREIDAALARAQHGAALERDFREVAKLMGRRAACEQRLKDWLANVEKDYPVFSQWYSPAPRSLAECRACLGENEVALLYVTGAAASYLVVVEKKPRAGDGGADDVAIYPVAKAREIEEWVHAVLDQDRLGSRRPRTLEAEGYRMLLGAAADRIRGKDLVIVPTGELCYLPFELLVEKGDGDPAEGRFLVEQHRIRYAPSLSVLHLIQQWETTRPRPERMLWGMADPVYEADDERVAGQGDLGAASRQALAEYLSRTDDRGSARRPLRRLSYSGAELAAVAALFDASQVETLTGLKASEAIVKASSEKGDLARYRYLHFATHGILGQDVGRQPSLVLSLPGNGGGDDGFLQLDEVMRLRLNADLVVLSACETGRGRLHNGEGVRGLARAFLYAGSRGVACSLWRVDDKETADLMTAFYRELKAGKPAPDALRNAKLQFIQAGKPPRDWAPFILMGE